MTLFCNKEKEERFFAPFFLFLIVSFIKNAHILLIFISLHFYPLNKVILMINDNLLIETIRQYRVTTNCSPRDHLLVLCSFFQVYTNMASYKNELYLIIFKRKHSNLMELCQFQYFPFNVFFD